MNPIPIKFVTEYFQESSLAFIMNLMEKHPEEHLDFFFFKLKFLHRNSLFSKEVFEAKTQNKHRKKEQRLHYRILPSPEVKPRNAGNRIFLHKEMHVCVYIYVEIDISVCVYIYTHTQALCHLPDSWDLKKL